MSEMSHLTSNVMPMLGDWNQNPLVEAERITPHLSSDHRAKQFPEVLQGVIGTARLLAVRIPAILAYSRQHAPFDPVAPSSRCHLQLSSS